MDVLDYVQTLEGIKTLLYYFLPGFFFLVYFKYSILKGKQKWKNMTSFELGVFSVGLSVLFSIFSYGVFRDALASYYLISNGPVEQETMAFHSSVLGFCYLWSLLYLEQKRTNLKRILILTVTIIIFVISLTFSLRHAVLKLRHMIDSTLSIVGFLATYYLAKKYLENYLK